MEQMKRYYDINEVAEIFSVEPSALRYWEKQFPHLTPKRDSRNRRRYTKADIDEIQKIRYQLEVQGRTIAGARNQMSHREEAQNLILRLGRIRDFLSDLRDNLEKG